MEVKRQHNVVVSKDTAVFLREHGHNEYCDCYLHTDNDNPWNYEMGNNQQCNSSLLGERVAAPYVTDAVLWLMQHKGIALEVATPVDKDSETGFTYIVSLKWGDNLMSRCGNIDYQKALVVAVDRLLEDNRFTLSPNPSYQAV